MSQLFGTPHQLGYVVRDIQKAMRHWAEVMKIGPFYYFERMYLESFEYRGCPSSLEATVAIAYSGTLQIELVQQLNAADSAFADFLSTSGEGLHHIGYLTDNFARDMQLACEAGLIVEQTGTVKGQSGRFASFESAGMPGTSIEIIALNQQNLSLFQMIRAEAAHWDGSGPIRLIGL